MKSNSLAQLIDRLNFQRAFRRVKHDSEYDFIQFPIELRIFEDKFDENIDFLKSSIKQGNYSVKSLRKIWVPKRNYLLRPGSIPALEDRIIFQALIDEIAPLLEAHVIPMAEEVVYSSRLHSSDNSERMFLHPRDLWLSFKDKAIEYSKSSEINFVLLTDIASYFENIDLRLLIDTVNSAGVSPDFTDAVRRILSIWANGRTRGLPQMMAPCSLLANVYLSQVDRNMVLLGYKYIRYVDDIRIFVSSEVELRRALLDLTNQLKACYLDVQASKTKFEKVEEHKVELTLLENHLVEVGIDIAKAASSSYTKSKKTEKRIPEGKLIEFLSNLIENPTYDDRHLRFCVNHLGYIGSPRAVDLVISKLSTMPQETDTFVQYLLRLKSSEIPNEKVDLIISFLDSDENIYDWQMMWLLIFLIHRDSLTSSQCKNLFGNEKLKKHPIVKAIWSYLLCYKGDLSLKRNFLSQYGQETSPEVRMAILCGVYKLVKQERNRFYAIAAKDRHSTQLINILKNREPKFV